MHDRGKILAGLAVFVILATAPLWLNGLSGSPETPPLARPANGATECVEDTAFMRTRHMDLLDDWRTRVVRQGQRQYTSTTTGRTYTMSLTKTCLDCHGERASFCDRCHDTVGITPKCYDCHLEAPR